jgi:hypothetical protein
MKRYIVELIWYEDKGMYETATTAKEFEINAKDFEEADFKATSLQNRHGAFEYEITEG